MTPPTDLDRRAAGLVADTLTALHAAALDAERALATYQEVASRPAAVVPERTAATLRPYADRLADAAEGLRSLLAPEPERPRR